MSPRTEIRSLPFALVDRRRRPILFREATEEDHARILKMYQDFEPKESYQGLPPRDPERLRSWVANMLEGRVNIAGLSFEQDCIAHGAVFRIDDVRAEFILAVCPEYQDSGIGTLLTRLIKRASQELGFRRMWLCVEPINAKAIHIYNKLGFHVTVREIDEYEMQADLDDDPIAQAQVGHVMTREVLSVRPDHTVRQVIEMFLDHDISGMPVISLERQVVGFVTETDVLDRKAQNRQVSDIMTREVVSIPEHTRLEGVIERIRDGHVKQIPVVDSSGRLVGIVCRRDLLRHLFR